MPQLSACLQCVDLLILLLLLLLLVIIIQSLLDKYLEPAKSLHEAAHRAWLPIGSSRTLVFDRRQQKAAAVQTVSEQQLMDWYDLHVQPEGEAHHALYVHVWGGAKGAPAAEVVQQSGAAAGHVVVTAVEVEAFKQSQCTLPLPAMQLPS